MLTETQQRILKKFESDANFWVENRYCNQIINEDLVYSIKMALNRLIQNYENVGLFLHGASKRLSFDVSRVEVDDVNFDSRFDIPCECKLNITLCIDGIPGYDEEKMSEIVSKHVEPIHSSFVKVYDHALSYDEIAKEYKKLTEEAKMLEKPIVTAKQQFPAIRKCIKDILKQIIDHASDPSMSEQVFPKIEEQIKTQEENIKWRDSWYERYDDE